MPTPTEIELAITKLTTDSNLLHNIVHGGVGSSVVTEGGTVPSVAKAINDLSAQIILGYAAGFVATAANNAARLNTVPAQVGQLLIQLDTKDIYYSTSLVTGAWTLHPVQNSAADAAAALAGLTTLTTVVNGKMTIADYVGGLAAGVVRTSERVESLITILTAKPDIARHVYGIEKDTIVVAPMLANAITVDLPDGLNNLSDVSNTSRRNQAPGTGFAIVNSPKRLVSWGNQVKAGILGTAMTTLLSYRPRFVLSQQQPDRNLPGFDPTTLYATAGQVEQVVSQGSITMIRTQAGLILAAGAITSGVKALFGSGVDKSQLTFMPIYFNDGGTNRPIRLFDIADPIGNTTDSTGIFVDDTEGVWLLTSNPTAAGYGNGLVGAQNVPVKLNAGFPSWAGKIVKKVRCDASGGIYVLFTNGELWAGGGNNSTGLLGTGSTSNVLNPLQIATTVDDFDISGDTSASLALWILQGTTLKGAGYNANGQLAQSTNPTTNRSSFVTVASNVELVRIGGTDNVSVYWMDNTGAWRGAGRGTDGNFGQGGTVTTNSTPVLLSNLTLTISDNGGLVSFVVSGVAGKHAACVVCGNGQAFTAGNNTDGALANGAAVNASTWQRVLWTPLDKWEKIVDVSSGVGANSGPSFMFKTSYGRLLMSGSTKFGYASGNSAIADHTLLTATPVDFNAL